MFHDLIQKLRNQPLHRLLFYIFLISVPLQTRVLFAPGSAYVDWYFSYHLAYFLYLNDLIFIVLIASWFGTKPLVSRETLILTSILGIIPLISLFHVQHWGLGGYNLLKWVELILLFLYVSNEKPIKTIFKIFWLLAIVQGLLGYLQFHVKHGFGLAYLGEYVPLLTTPGAATFQANGETYIRAYGTFPHPNILAGFLVIGLIMGLFFVSRATSNLSKAIVSCGTFVIIIGLFATFSRISWFFGIILFILFFLWNLLNKNINSVKHLSVLFFVSCATLTLFYWDPIVSRATIDTNSHAFQGRKQYNTWAIESIKQQPWGVGPGQYIDQLRHKQIIQPWETQPPHNIFLFIFAEFGVLGILLFILFHIKLFQDLLITWKELTGFTLLILGLAIITLGSFDHYFVTIQQGRLLLFIIFGLMTAYAQSNQIHSQNNHS